MSLLNDLTKITTKKAKRIGRGYGSGKGGHTSTRGQKGQKSRSGSKIPLWFEGGQLPIVKRMPMTRGKGRFGVVRPSAQISLTDLDQMQASTITLDSLKLEKVIGPRFHKAKVVKTGQISRKIIVKGIKVSTQAKAEIIKAGGSVEE